MSEYRITDPITPAAMVSWARRIGAPSRTVQTPSGRLTLWDVCGLMLASVDVDGGTEIRAGCLYLNTAPEDAIAQDMVSQVSQGEREGVVRAVSHYDGSDMVSLAEYARARGRAPSRVRTLCIAGAFRTAKKIGKSWMLSSHEPYPEDRRVKSGRYIGIRHDND